MLTLQRALLSLKRPRTALALAGLEVAVLAAVNGLDFPLSVPFVQRLTGHAYLDMCAFCSSAAVQQELLGLGPQGRLLQALLLSSLDLLIPSLSFLFGVSALSALLTRWPGAGWGRWLVALPALALVLDLAENGTIVLLLLQFPAPSPAIALLEGLLSGLKFAAYGAVVVSIAALLVARALGPRAALPA